MITPAGRSGATIRYLLQTMTEDLSRHGSDTPRLDAELLLAFVLDKPRSFLFAHPEHTPSAAQYSALKNLLDQRRAGRPVAHLLGEREFWSQPFRITPDTLIPRPDTETTVELALEKIPPDAAWSLLDLGTGSGVIALTLAMERPGCEVVATDRSAAALAVAEHNRQHLGLANVELVEGDWLTPLGGRRFDLIVSNPPYVAAGDAHLTSGDLRFEPAAALVSGPDGLDDLRTLVAAAPGHLHAGGWLVLEHGEAQREAVAGLLAAAGFRHIVCRRDLAGRPRASAAQYIKNP